MRNAVNNLPNGVGYAAMVMLDLTRGQCNYRWWDIRIDYYTGAFHQKFQKTAAVCKARTR